MDLSNLLIRPLTRDEFDIAIEWAAAEGWNPGLSDADVFWNTDPEGFVGAEYEGELIATGSIVSYGGQFGFMGFFIVKPGKRGEGIGSQLWHYRRDLLISRLKEDTAIGMDGVFDMQAWYGRGGFEFAHRNLRMEGVGRAVPDSQLHREIIPLSGVTFAQVNEYDRQCFGCERRGFLRSWINMPNSYALGWVSEGQLKGYGVIRPCREGFKIGPLFADDEVVAASLFEALGNHAAGAPIWLDVPEINREAMKLAEENGMKEVFGCARMYLGGQPSVPWDQIYGITTFELG